MRSLSPEEAELWARVASTIRPLSRDLQSCPERESEPAKAVEVGKRKASATLDARTPQAARPRALPIAEKTLDSSWDKRLRGGSFEPDRVLDLHGMSLDTAWAAIDRGLEQALARGDRILLLITGHHRPGEPPVQRGRIRAAVHDWLAASRHASNIAAVRGAHRRHGGGGSLYLILRRKSARR